MSDPDEEPDSHATLDELRNTMREFDGGRRRLINLEQRGILADD